MWGCTYVIHLAFYVQYIKNLNGYSLVPDAEVIMVISEIIAQVPGLQVCTLCSNVSFYIECAQMYHFA